MSADDSATTPRYPGLVVPENGVAPVPRRLRATLGNELVFDTTRALYVWEKPYYPQYNVPLEDVRGDFAEREFAQVYREGPAAGTVHFEWNALDAWFEEDEEVFVHARNPYARVDALRCSRQVRVELDGVVLAEAGAIVIVFETGLPPRHYFERTAVNFEHLRAQRAGHRMPLQGHDQRLLVGPHSATPSTPTSPGPTTSRPASCCRSPASSPSSTSTSTPSSTARSRRAR